MINIWCMKIFNFALRWLCTGITWPNIAWYSIQYCNNLSGKLIRSWTHNIPILQYPILPLQTNSSQRHNFHQLRLPNNNLCCRQQQKSWHHDGFQFFTLMDDLWVSNVCKMHSEENWPRYKWTSFHKQKILYADSGRPTPLHLIWSYWSMQSGITTESLLLTLPNTLGIFYRWFSIAIQRQWKCQQISNHYLHHLCENALKVNP